MSRMSILFLISLLLSCNSNTPQQIETENKSPKVLVAESSEQEFIDISTLADTSIIIKMAYATKNNFLKKKIYPCAKCFLRREVVDDFLALQQDALHKGYRLVLFDCYRPLSLQQKMFDIIPDTRFVADPKRGSNHNKGVAVDISLADKNGNALDMGTGFDDFSEKASIYNKQISRTAQANRKVLHRLMKKHNFLPYEKEWWHFSHKNNAFDNEDFVWPCDE